MMKDINTASLTKELESLNVCPRCKLRFLSVKSYSCYITKQEVHKTLKQLQNPGESVACSSDSSQDELEYSQAPKRLHASPCASCLGLLQDQCDEMPSKIEDAVKRSGFTFSEFVLQLSVPVVIDLRQYLIIHYLKDKLGTSYESDVEDVPTAKEVWKWVVGSQLCDALNVEFTPKSNFHVAISVLYSDTANECQKLLESCPEAFPNKNRRKAKLEDIYNRTSVLKAIEKLSSKLKNLYPLPPVPPDKPCTYEDITCTHSPLYLAGRYNKYSRELSQTPWIVNGERRMESSVQELITETVSKWITSDSMSFSASGREDVDVKMLGSGRPFILEVINPRRIQWSAEEMKAIENAVNSSTDVIAVKDLQVISKQDTQYLKEGEEQKRKTYTALCIVQKVLQADDLVLLKGLQDITVKQKTPIRVLHRRTLATRDKVIHSIDGTILGPHHLELKMETQAGTYVKEFVHSDFGRTVPNVGTLLGTEADILELDVESIHLDWPPKVDSVVK